MLRAWRGAASSALLSFYLRTIICKLDDNIGAEWEIVLQFTLFSTDQADETVGMRVHRLGSHGDRRMISHIAHCALPSCFSSIAPSIRPSAQFQRYWRLVSTVKLLLLWSDLDQYRYPSFRAVMRVKDPCLTTKIPSRSSIPQMT
jgi:hypothetical protein